MNSSTINFNDLAVAKEIIPFVRLRIRIMWQRIFQRKIGGGGNTLVVVPCILGDCLSYMPAVQAFADQSHTSYDIVVSPDFRSIAERLRGVRRVYVASSSYNRATEQGCRREQGVLPEYDRIFVLRLSRDALDLIRHTGGLHTISSDATLFRYVLHLAKCSLLNRPVKQSRELMFEVFGLKCNTDVRDLYDLYVPHGDSDDIATKIPAIECRETKVLIHTGSGWAVKLWSDDKWVNLLRSIHSCGTYRFFFVGRGDQERTTFERIQAKLEFKVYSLIDSVDLWELFLIMKRSDFFIGIDSGPRNLAHYANLRSITLLNPAAVKNFMPFDHTDIVVEKPNRFPANIVNTKREANVGMICVEDVFDAFKRLAALSLSTLPSRKTVEPGESSAVTSPVRESGIESSM